MIVSVAFLLYGTPLDVLTHHRLGRLRHPLFDES